MGALTDSGGGYGSGDGYRGGDGDGDGRSVCGSGQDDRGACRTTREGDGMNINDMTTEEIEAYLAARMERAERASLLEAVTCAVLAALEGGANYRDVAARVIDAHRATGGSEGLTVEVKHKRKRVSADDLAARVLELTEVGQTYTAKEVADALDMSATGTVYNALSKLTDDGAMVCIVGRHGGKGGPKYRYQRVA